MADMETPGTTLPHPPYTIQGRGPFTMPIRIGSPSKRILTPNTLPSVLLEVLNAAGLTQAQLASRLGIKIQSVNQYLHTTRANPSLEWLQRFVETCGCRLIVEMPNEPIDGGL